tara:strand:+ start:48 stop:1043 length:996 start_codon:yes stop_codon:yes gene_type:complete
MFVSHDTGGNRLFIEEVDILHSNTNAGGGLAINFNTHLREILYPLRPLWTAGTGYPFNNLSGNYTIGGLMDRSVILQESVGELYSGSQNSILNGLNEDDPDPDDINNLFQVGAPMTLTALFKFGRITGDEIYNGPAANLPADKLISIYSLKPNTATTSNVLGLEHAYQFNQQALNHVIETDPLVRPFSAISEPTLHIELPQFNIKSYIGGIPVAGGGSGDTGNSICVIPKTQWATDENTGTLHFNSNYSQPIKLNLATIESFYNMNCKIRTANGQLANDLINPTEITLRVTETPESKQQTVMNNAMKVLAEFSGNKQDAKISNVMADMPRL